MKDKLLEELAQLTAPEVAAMRPAGRPAVDPRDVAIFNAALGEPARSHSSAHNRSIAPAASAQPENGESVLGMLSAFAAGHENLVHRVEKNLLRVAKTADPMRMYKLNQQYSALMLQHAMAMKVVSKTSQALDQLTKLQ